MEGNTGPDGCAVFYKEDKFNLVSWQSRVLQVWRVESNQVGRNIFQALTKYFPNQVGMVATLRHKLTGRELCVVTTHLKARKGALLSTLRAEQGADILTWLTPIVQGRPVIITGDFNAQPAEPVFSTMTNNDKLSLRSCYDTQTLEWTTWKIRDTGEEKYVLDYIFHSQGLETVQVLDTPEAVGEARLPSLQYASDHLSLVADLSFV